MTKVHVVVTRRGQTTIPALLRRRLEITEGTRLEVSSKGNEIILRRARTTFDLAGTSKLSQKEAFEPLDKLRSGE